MLKTVVIGAVATGLALGGCARLRDHQGYMVDEQLLGAVQPGVDNKESVGRTLGRPSFASEWDDNVWYYVARSTQQLAFLPQKVTGQNVLIVTFDEAGNVASVDRRDSLEQIASFDPADAETPVRGRESNLFDDIFGNIGAVGTVPGGAGGPPQQ